MGPAIGIQEGHPVLYHILPNVANGKYVGSAITLGQQSVSNCHDCWLPFCIHCKIQSKSIAALMEFCRVCDKPAWLFRD